MSLTVSDAILKLTMHIRASDDAGGKLKRAVEKMGPLCLFDDVISPEQADGVCLVLDWLSKEFEP